jgi:spore coat-associated protein N
MGDTPAPPGKTLLGGTGRKVLLSLGALGVAGGLAGMGTFATFTATTSASSTLASGTVVIALGNTGASTNRLTVNASGLVPGDTVQRSFDLSNTGSQDLASVALTTTASPSSLLDTDTTNGLQMVVDRCSVAWTESGSSPAFSYACGGSTTTILTTRAVIQSALTMSGLSALTAAGTDHLRLTLTFPGTAGASLQGLSSTLTYSFLGTQRAGAAH